MPNSNKLPSWELGLELFRDNVAWSQKYPIHRNLYGTLLTQIQIEREGAVISRSAVKSCIDMLFNLSYPMPHVAFSQRPSLYLQEFEPAFLHTSVEFYRAEAEHMLERGDAAQYLRHVERRFLEEEERVTVYLKPSTAKDLRMLLETYLLSHHLSAIIEMPGSGIVAMLDEHRDQDLARMYTLFRRVSRGVDELRRGLRTYILSKGAQINDTVSTIDATSSAGVAIAGIRKVSKSQEDADAPGNDTPAEGGSPAAATGKPRKSAAAGGAAPGAADGASSAQAALALRWVEQILEFKSRFDSLLSSAFRSDSALEGAISEVSNDSRGVGAPS